jgi:hypothetical protein
MTEQVTWSGAQEMAVYRAGQKVAIKHRPGVTDTVIAYDPMMVPPVILANDPQPRYPEELILISQPATAFDWLHPWTKSTPDRAIPTSRRLVKA